MTAYTFQGRALTVHFTAWDIHNRRREGRFVVVNQADVDDWVDRHRAMGWQAIEVWDEAPAAGDEQ